MLGLMLGLALPAAVLADASGDDGPSLKEQMLAALPPAIGDGLDIDVWGWAGDLQTLGEYRTNYYDLELGVGVSKTFDQRVTVAAQGNLIDANGTIRVELETAYASAKVQDEGSTLLTIGKMNADFGVEGRDFWTRRTGTPSLLFAAQPQDLIGVELTQPIGESGVTLRPFVSADFQGGYNFDQSPSAGVNVSYRPTRNLDLKWTNWVGPGFVLMGGRPLRYPFEGGSYGADPAAAVVENWQGPHLTAEAGGTLYFTEVAASVHVTPDLTLSAEYLYATSGTHLGRWGWQGFLVTADDQVTDELHVFGMWSFLDDSDWLVTGIFQTCQELSCGFGYQIYDGVELRCEYRHDFSNVTDDFDSVSAHLTFTY